MYLDKAQHSKDNIFHASRQELPEYPIQHLDNIPLSQYQLLLCCLRISG